MEFVLLNSDFYAIIACDNTGIFFITKGIVGLDLR